MVDEERQREIEDLRDSRATHMRILSRTQGRRDGWFAVVEELRKMAAEAYVRDDDRTAERLREIARKFSVPNPLHPYLVALDEGERESLVRIEAANARLAEIDPET